MGLQLVAIKPKSSVFFALPLFPLLLTQFHQPNPKPLICGFQLLILWKLQTFSDGQVTLTVRLSLSYWQTFFFIQFMPGSSLEPKKKKNSAYE